MERLYDTISPRVIATPDGRIVLAGTWKLITQQGQRKGFLRTEKGYSYDPVVISHNISLVSVISQNVYDFT
jgi:hypothetical protein